MSKIIKLRIVTIVLMLLWAPSDNSLYMRVLQYFPSGVLVVKQVNKLYPCRQPCRDPVMYTGKANSYCIDDISFLPSDLDAKQMIFPTGLHV
jgi:hypothetical protein